MFLLSIEHILSDTRSPSYLPLKKVLLFCGSPGIKDDGEKKGLSNMKHSAFNYGRFNKIILNTLCIQKMKIPVVT